MNHFEATYLISFVVAFAVAIAATWVVVTRFGDVGRLVMVVIVPVLAIFWIWPLAGALGPNDGCTDDCEGNAVFGVVIFAGLVIGIAIAATGTWARDRRRLKN